MCKKDSIYYISTCILREIPSGWKHEQRIDSSLLCAATKFNTTIGYVLLCSLWTKLFSLLQLRNPYSWICRVRFHYGHPDIFDRIFHITRGGISKASKVINLSEDIFAGTNKKAYLTDPNFILNLLRSTSIGLNQNLHCGFMLGGIFY